MRNNQRFYLLWYNKLTYNQAGTTRSKGRRRCNPISPRNNTRKITGMTNEGTPFPLLPTWTEQHQTREPRSVNEGTPCETRTTSPTAWRRRAPAASSSSCLCEWCSSKYTYTVIPQVSPSACPIIGSAALIWPALKLAIWGLNFERCRSAGALNLDTFL